MISGGWWEQRGAHVHARMSNACAADRCGFAWDGWPGEDQAVSAAMTMPWIADSKKARSKMLRKIDRTWSCDGCGRRPCCMCCTSEGVKGEG